MFSAACCAQGYNGCQNLHTTAAEAAGVPLLLVRRLLRALRPKLLLM